VLIGGVLVGTVLTLLFLPALCSLVLGRTRTKTAETSHVTAR
jgi:Cu/Ag efflux pump CusA